MLRYALKIFVLYFTRAGLLNLEQDDLQSLAKRQGPLIIAPNHLALWDAVFLIAEIPELVCLMKGAILRNPFLGGGARLAAYLPNDSSAQMLLAAKHSTKHGAKLLLFPEGTRTRSEARWINPCKGGIALLAKYSSAPIVPVYIRSNSRFLEKDRPLFKMPDFPITMSINVGPDLHFPPGLAVADFRQQLEEHFINELSREHPLRRTNPGEAGKIA